MAAFLDATTPHTRAWTNGIQLQRLARNQRDITQFLEKLCSYKCEPRTHGQYDRLNDLKDRALKLRDANSKILTKLRNEPCETDACSKLLKQHLQDFDNFSKEVQGYLGDTKVHRTSYI